MKTYGTIKNLRLLNVKIIKNETLLPIFEGMIEDIPEELKELKYSKIILENPILLYV